MIQKCISSFDEKEKNKTEMEKSTNQCIIIWFQLIIHLNLKKSHLTKNQNNANRYSYVCEWMMCTLFIYSTEEPVEIWNCDYQSELFQFDDSCK